MEQSYAGLVAIDDDILVLTVSPIHNSFGDSPVGGWLIWGQYLSAVFPSRHMNTLSSENTMVTVTPEHNIDDHLFPMVYVENDGKNVAASVILNDINGKPVAILKSSRPRTIYQGVTS